MDGLDMVNFKVGQMVRYNHKNPNTVKIRYNGTLLEILAVESVHCYVRDVQNNSKFAILNDNLEPVYKESILTYEVA